MLGPANQRANGATLDQHDTRLRLLAKPPYEAAAIAAAPLPALQVEDPLDVGEQLFRGIQLTVRAMEVPTRQVMQSSAVVEFSTD